MDLHGQIMNLTIPIGTGFAPGTSGDDGYRMGHRDACHAAAELALEADAEIKRMRGALLEIGDSDSALDWCREVARSALVSGYVGVEKQ